MKNLKKYRFKLILLAALITTLGIFGISNINAATSAPTTFTGGAEKVLEGYIDDWGYGKLTSSLGGYVYCQDFNKGIPYGVTMTLDGEAPAGIAYILSNGYPSVSITGDSDKDYYITQAAVWWYEDLYMGGHNLPDSFKETGSDPYNLRPYIKKLVDEAGKITTYATPAIKLINNDTTLNLTSDKKYYESSAISVKSLYTTGNYTITLTNAPKGTTVVNATTGVQETTFTGNESFKVRVPEESVEVGDLNITIKATATGSINKAYKYKSANPSKQSVIGSLLYPETSTVEAETNLTLATSKVTITKIDDENEKPLAGATFELKDSTGRVVTTWTSTTSSHVIKNLPNGTYTLKETKAPAGYILNDQDVKFTITDTNRNIAIRFKNRAIDKQVTIIKVDAETGKALAGAVLVVKDSTGKVIEEFTTTTSEYSLKGLANGTYTVEETKAPAGYEKIDKVVKFTISDTNNKIKIVIENKAIEKVTEIIKIDADTKKPVAGAVLVVKDSTGKVIEEFTTTTSSHVLKDLANGTYTVEETKAPAGYEKTEEVFEFTISDTNNNAQVVIENKKITKKAEIIKIDADTKKPVAGAVLVVKDSTGKVIEEFTTTTKPHLLENLADGTYRVEETKAPAGYEKTEEIFEFTISDTNNKAEITIENKAIEKLVNILKVDAETGNPLEGAVLVIKDSTGKIIEEFTTTKEPHTILNLQDGEYTVEEIKAPEGYKKSDDIYKFTISDETPAALVIFENNEIVEVPFTGSNKSLITTLFGTVLLISGVGFVYYNGKKQKVK